MMDNRGVHQVFNDQDLHRLPPDKKALPRKKPFDRRLRAMQVTESQEEPPSQFDRQQPFDPRDQPMAFNRYTDYEIYEQLCILGFGTISGRDFQAIKEHVNALPEEFGSSSESSSNISCSKKSMINNQNLSSTYKSGFKLLQSSNNSIGTNLQLRTTNVCPSNEENSMSSQTYMRPRIFKRKVLRHINGERVIEESMIVVPRIASDPPCKNVKMSALDKSSKPSFFKSSVVPRCNMAHRKYDPAANYEYQNFDTCDQHTHSKRYEALRNTGNISEELFHKVKDDVNDPTCSKENSSLQDSPNSSSEHFSIMNNVSSSSPSKSDSPPLQSSSDSSFGSYLQLGATSVCKLNKENMSPQHPRMVKKKVLRRKKSERAIEGCLSFSSTSSSSIFKYDPRLRPSSKSSIRPNLQLRATHVVKPSKENLSSQISIHPRMVKRKVMRHINDQRTIRNGVRVPRVASKPLWNDDIKVPSTFSSSSYNLSSRMQSLSLGKPSKSSSPKSSVILPKYNVTRRKHDPVARYHEYRKYWDTFKPPGEKKHSSLRWTVREKMLDYDFAA